MDPTQETMQRVVAAVDAWCDRNADAIDNHAARINDLRERLDAMETAANRPGGVGTPAIGGLTPDAREALAGIGQFAKSGSEAGLVHNSNSVADDPGGGYIVNPVVSDRMTKRLFDASPMRRLTRVETITSGDAWVEPIDRSDVEAVWVGEKEARPETQGPDLGLLTIPVDEVYALIPVTQRLLDDSPMNVGMWIEGKITDRFARTEGAAVVNGNSVKKPEGFLSVGTDLAADFASPSRPKNTLQKVISGHATQVTADSLRDLYWSLRAPYRANGTWVMASETANAIDKLKTGDGQYIWRPAQTAGAPNMLLGRPVEFAEDMPAVQAGAHPIAFGDFRRGYTLVDKLGIRFLRDPFSNKPFVLFYAYRRTGGAVADFDAIKILEIAA